MGHAAHLGSSACYDHDVTPSTRYERTPTSKFRVISGCGKGCDLDHTET